MHNFKIRDKWMEADRVSQHLHCTLTNNENEIQNENLVGKWEMKQDPRCLDSKESKYNKRKKGLRSKNDRESLSNPDNKKHAKVCQHFQTVFKYSWNSALYFVVTSVTTDRSALRNCPAILWSCLQHKTGKKTPWWAYKSWTLVTTTQCIRKWSPHFSTDTGCCAN